MTLPNVVLFIDDDDDDRELLCEATSLISSSISRLTASNGLEALQLLGKPDSITPDLIFLDINMPVMNGIECLRELRKLAKLDQTPIIICSTSPYTNSQQPYESSGADFYMVKPDTLVKTANLLQFVFERHHAKKDACEYC